jgi:hypothetical protein
MSKRTDTFQSIRNNLPNFKRQRTSSALPPSLTPLSGPSDSGSAVVPPVNTDQPQPLPGPSSSGGSSSLSADGDHAPQSQSSLAGGGNINHFDSLLNHTDAPWTVLRDIGGVAYEGFKGVVAMADTVGYALPPLKAGSDGAGRVMKVYDVCTSSQQMTAQDSRLRQNMGQNRKGFEAIQDTLDAIISIITKYKQHGSQGAPGEAVAGPSRIADYSTSVISSCSIAYLGTHQRFSALQHHKDQIERVQQHGRIRRGIENVKDAGLVSQSFRDIGLAKGIFDVNDSPDYAKSCSLN